jgi:GNAT superfamily N-acetyltransferase
LPAWLLQFGRLTLWVRPLGAAERAMAVDPDIAPAPDDRPALLAELPESERGYWRGTILSDMPIHTLRRDGRLVGMVASSPGSLRAPPWLRHAGGAHDIWGHGLWVLPDQRGGGIARHLMDQAAVTSVRDGYTRRLSIIAAGNRSSIRATQKTGYAPFGTAAYLRVLGFAVVRAGDRWFFGRCDGDRPLEIPIAAHEAADRSPDALREAR